MGTRSKEAPSASGNWHTGRKPTLSGAALPRPFAQHTLEAPTPPERVWELWSNLDEWPKFYPRLAAVEPACRIKPGLAFRLSSTAGGGHQRYEVIAFEPDRAFTLLRRLPLARLNLRAQVEPCPMGARLNLRLDLEGPLAWWYTLVQGRSWKAALPPLLRALGKEAQRQG